MYAALCGERLPEEGLRYRGLEGGVAWRGQAGLGQEPSRAARRRVLDQEDARRVAS